MTGRLALHLVTDRHQTSGRPLLDVVKRALAGGVRVVQLREKDLCAREYLEVAIELRRLTGEYGALLLINDRVDIALACGADGVHLPAASFRASDARRLLGPSRLIGVSTHGLEDVRQAVRDSADYVFFGPVFETPSKHQYGAPLGLKRLREAVDAAAPVPVIAIGGIDARRRLAVQDHGAAGIAVIRAVLAAEDPAAASAALRASFGGPPA